MKSAKTILSFTIVAVLIVTLVELSGPAAAFSQGGQTSEAALMEAVFKAATRHAGKGKKMTEAEAKFYVTQLMRELEKMELKIPPETQRELERIVVTASTTHIPAPGTLAVEIGQLPANAPQTESAATAGSLARHTYNSPNSKFAHRQGRFWEELLSNGSRVTWTETNRTPDYVELRDEARMIMVRIHSSVVEWCAADEYQWATVPPWAIIPGSNGYWEGQGIPTGWYKLQFYTHRGDEGRWGGTDGDVYLNMLVGDHAIGAHPLGVLLDSPGDSHEQGDYDVYYFNAPTALALDPKSARVTLISSAKNQVDNWSFSLKLFQWCTTQWRLVHYWPNEESYATKLPFLFSRPPNGDFLKARCHWDSSEGRWQCEREDQAPKGANLRVVH